MQNPSGKPLQGRHGFVTGGGRGIGKAIASELARLGADVSVLGRDASVLGTTAREIESAHGVKTAAIVADLTRAEEIASAISSAIEQLGTVSILVNNAGIAYSAPFLKTGLDKWNEVLAIDLTSAFLCTQQVLKPMISAGFGRIVNVSSTSGLTGCAYVTAYCAAKHGLIGLTRALAMEVAKTGVTVNAVCPGFTDTDIVTRSVDNIVAKTGRTAEQALAQLVVHNPQGRLIQPEEVAEAVGWLCLPGSRSITGQSIAVAGGELM
ncbi:NAD(P)-dependent dehydrogenase (short-subunit alcohol dehydrogenase family) [Roseiarcus fermentans]|uniref:NAD(P)-dependent dehydrogenase (Short-subunit alcohol dehydrogenase family) n=1 Tax=Roseiarcus fermentans TaxID=1473586 RepID=A0A366EL75_9HYPH|nr:SDR family NAD(P)-dependent oxidoreductase [Roseiarcus fermentans]RBP02219.1 NAD(P)-dependent dehydrogenase (short-subunit alcohol dehydrogenase family) [Roseiarcus fermentans]